MVTRTPHCRVGLGCLLLVAALTVASARGSAQLLTTQRVASGFQRPLLVTSPPGDTERLFVVQQFGPIHIIKNGVVLPTPFLDVQSLVNCCGNQGLLGLAFHPDYATNGQFYVSHTTRGLQFDSVVARYTVSAGDPDIADPTSRQVLLTVPQPYPTHNVGMLAFGPDGYLYVGSGDGGSEVSGPNVNDPDNNAQNPQTLLGKILRLDVDGGSPYAIPPDNPFVGNPTTLDEIWALGVRNPWRFSFDRLTGDLWMADVGGRLEEVDFEPAGSGGGRNYGWACMAGKMCEVPRPPPEPPVCTCNAPTLTLPIHDYYNTAFPGANECIIGGYAYRGPAMPALHGTYFFADYRMGRIWSLRYDGTTVTEFMGRTAELAPGAGMSLSLVTSFGEDADGELYMCDHTGGEVYKIVPRAPIPGVAGYGTGTPGCDGTHILTATEAPTSGNATFGIECYNAPPNTLGVFVIGAVPDVAGTEALGVRLHVNLGFPALFAVMPSDATGTGSLTLPIPRMPRLVGSSLYMQAAWAWAGPCRPSSLDLSSSKGMTATIQP